MSYPASLPRICLVWYPCLTANSSKHMFKKNINRLWKAFLVAIAMIPVLASVATFTPELAGRSTLLNSIGLVAALLVLFLILVFPSKNGNELEEIKEKPVSLAPAAILSSPEVQASNRAAVAQFLSLLQTHGRFVDFLMEDISKYDDAQVGAAGRIIHQGCGALLRDRFDIQPIQVGSQNQTVTLNPGFRAEQFRLVGKVAGSPPFQGRLIHSGWKATKVDIPPVSQKDLASLPVIFPAELQVL